MIIGPAQILFLVYKILCGFWAMKVAARKGRKRVLWFIIGFLFDLLAIPIIYLLATKDVGEFE